MRHLPALLVALLLACASPYEPLVPEAEPMDPPALYYKWHREAAACAGVSRSFAAIRWYVVPGAYTYDVPGHEGVYGTWHEPNRIYIAEKKAMVYSAVVHEILHYLLQREDHPVPPFEVCEVP